MELGIRSIRCLLSLTCGQTHRMWAGVHTWGKKVLPGFGLKTSELSINARELLAVERALLFFAPQIVDCTVTIFADNSTAIAYLRNQGGTRSQLLNSISQRILRWAESLPVVLTPQFIMGRHNVMADSLILTQSDPGVGLDSEDRGLSRAAEAVAGVHRPFCHLTKSPMLPIFFTVPRSERARHGCSAPELEWVAGVCLSSLVPHSSGPQEASVVIWSPPDHHSSVLASEAMVPGPSGLGSGRSGGASSVARSSAPTTLPSSSYGSVRAVSSCLEIIQRFARSQGFSKHVAKQSALACRSSSSGLPGQVVHLSPMVSYERPFCILAFLVEDCGFFVLAA